jgi:hypothetical protein
MANGINDLERFDFVSGGMYPGSQIDHSYYADATQMPLGAQAVKADYDPETNPLTGEPVSRFAQGGIASIPRYDGEDGSQVETPPAWDPTSGQVKLAQPTDPKDPFSEVKQIDYTIPKDQIKTFIPNVDPLTNVPSGSGAYVLKDGSMLGVDNFGVVSAATPGRNDYTLNKQGYYQPTGANLTWDGSTSTLTKKIGGVDVMVPGQYHKGGYQDAQGNLRVDENGVPIPLLPNYLDSGMGKSGMDDAAPYITAAMMAAATMGAAAPVAGGFSGMVPASETLLGSMGYLAPTASTVGISSADLGTTPYIAASGDVTSSAFPGVSSADLGTSSYIAPSSSVAETGATGPATIHDFSTPYNGPLNYAGEKVATGMTAKQIAAASLASSMMAKGAGGTGGSTSAPTSGQTTTTQSAPVQPQMVQQPIMMANNNPMASYYMQPIPTYKYYNQGGITSLAAGGIPSLGSYSDGGQLLKGPGDGMSDNIPAQIGKNQPAALADGEFVIPADVVSHLGNGSTDAGAKQLYKMMDRIRKARTGNHKQGKRINPDKFLPKE